MKAAIFTLIILVMLTFVNPVFKGKFLILFLLFTGVIGCLLTRSGINRKFPNVIIRNKFKLLGVILGALLYAWFIYFAELDGTSPYYLSNSLSNMILLSVLGFPWNIVLAKFTTLPVEWYLFIGISSNGLILGSLGDLFFNSLLCLKSEKK